MDLQGVSLLVEQRISQSSSNGYLSKRTSNSQYGLLRSNSASTLLKHGNISSRSFDGGSRSLERDKLIPDASGKDNVPTNTCDQNLISKTIGTHMESANGTPIGNTRPEHEDYVSGMLYDMLQKEVVSLRKACNERDQTLKDKDDAIEVGLHTDLILQPVLTPIYALNLIYFF